MKGKEIIVTGANSGIGYETAKSLAAQGSGITMVCRSRERGEESRQKLIAESGNPNIDLIIGDLSSMADIRQIAETYRHKHDRLDVLVNNAGGSFLSRRESVDGLELTFALNHINYFLLTHLLLDLIKATPDSRIVNVASGAHRMGTINFDDLQFTGRYRVMQAYGASKLANILFTNELARRLEAEGSHVTVNSLHPGVVKTNIGKRDNGLIGRIAATLFLSSGITPAEGAKTSIYLASSPEVAHISGKYFDNCKEKRPSDEALDATVAKRLWEVSEEICRLK